MKSGEFLQRYADALVSLRDNDEFHQQISRARDVVLNLPGVLYIAANGGSVATAHYVASHIKLPGGPCVATPSYEGMITATMNDFDRVTAAREYVARQLKRFRMSERDGLLVLSSSGNSENLVHATGFANSVGADTIGIIARRGSRLETDSTCSVKHPVVLGLDPLKGRTYVPGGSGKEDRPSKYEFEVMETLMRAAAGFFVAESVERRASE